MLANATGPAASRPTVPAKPAADAAKPVTKVKATQTARVAAAATQPPQADGPAVEYGPPAPPTKDEAVVVRGEIKNRPALPGPVPGDGDRPAAADRPPQVAADKAPQVAADKVPQVAADKAAPQPAPSAAQTAEKPEDRKEAPENDEEGEQGGSIEIEAGYIMGEFVAGRQHTTPIMITVALAPWIQAQVGSNGYTVMDGANFFDDIMAGFKFRLLEQTDHLPTVAVSALMSMPVLRDQLGFVPSYDALLSVYLTKDCTDWLALDFTLGFNLWNLSGERIFQLSGALAANFALPNDFSANFGVYGMTAADPYISKDAGLQLGVGWAPNSWLTIDALSDLALMRDIRSYSVSAGITITPPLRLY